MVLNQDQRKSGLITTGMLHGPCTRTELAALSYRCPQPSVLFMYYTAYQSTEYDIFVLEIVYLVVSRLASVNFCFLDARGWLQYLPAVPRCQASRPRNIAKTSPPVLPGIGSLAAAAELPLSRPCLSSADRAALTLCLRHEDIEKPAENAAERSSFETAHFPNVIMASLWKPARCHILCTTCSRCSQVHRCVRANMARRSRKAPTLAALVLFTGCVLRLVVGDEQCNVACASIKAETSSSEACSKARKSLPRPKIGRVCQVRVGVIDK